MFSEHAKLLLEQAFLQKIESSADASKMHILLIAFGLPTSFTFEPSAQCDEEKLDGLAGRICIEKDIVDTAKTCCVVEINFRPESLDPASLSMLFTRTIERAS